MVQTEDRDATHVATDADTGVDGGSRPRLHRLLFLDPLGSDHQDGRRVDRGHGRLPRGRGRGLHELRVIDKATHHLPARVRLGDL